MRFIACSPRAVKCTAKCDPYFDVAVDAVLVVHVGQALHHLPHHRRYHRLVVKPLWVHNRDVVTPKAQKGRKEQSLA